MYELYMSDAWYQLALCFHFSVIRSKIVQIMLGVADDPK